MFLFSIACEHAGSQEPKAGSAWGLFCVRCSLLPGCRALLPSPLVKLPAFRKLISSHRELLRSWTEGYWMSYLSIAFELWSNSSKKKKLRRSFDLYEFGAQSNSGSNPAGVALARCLSRQVKNDPPTADRTAQLAGWAMRVLGRPIPRAPGAGGRYIGLEWAVASRFRPSQGG